jgi:hypothetical protein
MCLGGNSTAPLPPVQTPVAVEKTAEQEKQAVNRALDKQRQQAAIASGENDSVLTGDTTGTTKLGQKGTG